MYTDLTTLPAVSAIQLHTGRPSSQNPARIYLASLSAGSVRTMTACLDKIAAIVEPGCALEDVPWHALRYEHVVAIRARLVDDGLSAASCNKHLSALRGVIKSAWRLGQMTADEYLRACDVPAVKGETPDAAAGRAVATGELLALVAACDDGTPKGVRDAAMLGVAYSCGLRRAEIVALDYESIRLVDDAAVLTVTGKRNKTRTVPIRNGARAALEDWISIRGDEPGPLFWHVRRGGELIPRRLTTQAVYQVMETRAAAAGVASFSPHDMRRTFAGDMLDAGADISTVQRLMGHSNVSTTAGYDRRGERAKIEAAGKLHFPYTRKAK